MSYKEQVDGKPDWLRIKLPETDNFARVRKSLDRLHVETVCRSAKCPNIFECFSRKVATFLILGPSCTRRCLFCSVEKGRPEPVGPDEPERISRAVSVLGLKHIVITSVTRDDLADGGARQFVKVLRRLRADHPDSILEVLIPDFQGSTEALDAVLDSSPDVLGHNIETVRHLYSSVRPHADYRLSLGILERAAKFAPQVRVKTGMMVGLGEKDEQVLEVIKDVQACGGQVMTIGQYLRPAKMNRPVDRYVDPETFAYYARAGREAGLEMFCGPFVRSSYHADKQTCGTI
ncbi:lipoyl synthase [Desulfonatronovibrio hydrogenovorans]|uniref:lipoyl synthase n=1 Tax=Desulfonatronovibrio hydrogenovorans TaxID=53245 RepID=UPI0004909CC2|nr:lipoyl synthase [Desulfonatronovibrio hydrogenovorans]